MRKTYPAYVAAEWTDTADGTVVRGQVVRQLKTVASVLWPNGHTEKGVKLTGEVKYGTLRFITLDEDWDAATVEQSERTPEVIHHDGDYGRGISCGATGRVRCEYAARLVTCKACIAADHARRVAEAERQAYIEDAERTAQAEWGDRAYRRAAEMDAAAPHMGHATDALIDEAHAGALQIGASHTAYRYGPAERVAGCTRTYDRTGEHVFEDDEIEYDADGYDEYERCGKPADDPSHVEGAHAAAIREDLMRAKMAQSGPLYARVRLYRATHRVGIREGVQAVKDEDHAEALAENAYRSALIRTRASARVANALAADNLQEVVDADHAEALQDDAFYRQNAKWRHRMQWQKTVDEDHIESLAEDAYRTELKTELGKFARGEDPYPYITVDSWSKPMTDDEHHAMLIEVAHREAIKDDAKRIIATSRAPEDATGPGLPEVPADVSDDQAWAAYCAALPQPTDQEIADVLDEYGDPYAAPRADAVQGYKNVARTLWQMRADVGRGNLSAEIEQQMRSAMRTFVGVIEVYDDLTEAWRIGNRTDANRDAATQTF